MCFFSVSCFCFLSDSYFVIRFKISFGLFAVTVGYLTGVSSEGFMISFEFSWPFLKLFNKDCNGFWSIESDSAHIYSKLLTIFNFFAFSLLIIPSFNSF